MTALLTLSAAPKNLLFPWSNDKVKTKEKVNGKRRNARGNSKDMRDDAGITLDTDLPPRNTLQLPGMIEVYNDDYHGVLFGHPDQSWRDSSQRM
ncbi:uncharacterized protein BDW70DRAFT_137601 [Aspergillus foveolatus]|uniref:uncharacterized protein n=1 Tax=Aspergillus foveolatus TaxID=210207 RepID=UPI003CCCFA2B